MFLRRKKEENEEETEKKTSFKRRGKRETFEPWGKKERLSIFLILFVTMFVSSFLALSARSWKIPGLPKLIPSELNLEKTYVLEKKGDNLVDFKFDGIKKEFVNVTNNLSGVYGLYVVRLDSGISYGINEKKSFQAASLIKLPVMVAFYMESEKGNIDLDSFYTLNDVDKIPGAGSLYYKPPGTKVSYRELVRLMGKESDNTAFGIARKVLGDKKINEVISKIGMRDTSLSENKTTPYDIGIYFQKLWAGELVSNKSRDEILDDLTKTVFESWIVAGIPEGIRVAHKYGREVHVVNDAGIVFSDEPFVLVLLTSGVIEKEADEFLPKLSSLVYEFETIKKN